MLKAESRKNYMIPFTKKATYLFINAQMEITEDLWSYKKKNKQNLDIILWRLLT